MIRASCILPLLVVLLSAQCASAWVLKGGVWLDPEIPLTLQLGGEPVELLDGSTSWNESARASAFRAG